LIFIDESSNFHPYECDGPGKCIHCDRTVSTTHEPATCALCQPEGITVSDQAASASRKYVILERSDQELWAIVGTVEAASVEQAIKAQAAVVSSDWQGGTLVAIPARSWAPKTVKVETQKTVTLA
jgi:hypothetical protein